MTPSVLPSTTLDFLTASMTPTFERNFDGLSVVTFQAPSERMTASPMLPQNALLAVTWSTSKTSDVRPTSSEHKSDSNT